MADEINTKEELVEEASGSMEALPDKEQEETLPELKVKNKFERRSFGSDRRKNERKPSKRPERARQEFDNKIISMRRVTRVVAGGRRFSFSVAIVIGDKKGRVGVGVGKAGDTPIAVEKATRAARKNLTTIKLNSRQSIPHAVEAKYSSARVMIMPSPGKGMVAGSSLRTVLELAGVKDVVSKILSRSKNKINIARAAIKALSQIKQSTNLKAGTKNEAGDKK
jgi:small subunit ribosomal protein S5